MAYDPVRRVVVLFGGTQCAVAWGWGCKDFHDTWTWDGRRWSERAAKPAPEGVPVAMFFDLDLQKIVLFDKVGMAWSWDGSGWSRRPQEASPVGREGGETFFDPVNFAIGYDELRRNTVLLATRLHGDASPPYKLTESYETWIWATNTWAKTWSLPPRELNMAIGPAGVRDRLPFDRDLGTLVALGSGMTWTWDGSSWTAHVGSSDHPGRLVYDPKGQRLLSIEPRCAGKSCSETVVPWSWDGREWTALSAKHSPKGGFIPPAVAYDEAHNQLVLFGGAPHV